MARDENRLQVRRLTEDRYAEWSRLVAGAPSGSLYALPDYLEIIGEATGGHFDIVGVFDDDALVGGHPLFVIPTQAGPLVAARPLLATNGPVLSAQAGNPGTLLAALERYLRKTDYIDLRLRLRHPIDPRPFRAAGWRGRPIQTYLVDLADMHLAWSRCHRNVRRLVRRAEEQGLSVTEDDDFDSFFRMHRETNHRKGLALYLSEPAFRRYVERLKAAGLGRLYQARLPNGEAVATQLVLAGGGLALTHTVCAASREAFMGLGSNSFLRWRVLESLARLGYLTHDLSGAAPDSPVTRFKRQFGGRLVESWAIQRPPRWRDRVRRLLHRCAALAPGRLWL